MADEVADEMEWEGWEEWDGWVGWVGDGAGIEEVAFSDCAFAFSAGSDT